EAEREARVAPRLGRRRGLRADAGHARRLRRSGEARRCPDPALGGAVVSGHPGVRPARARVERSRGRDRKGGFATPQTRRTGPPRRAGPPGRAEARAAGLDSTVVGEPQILSQVRRAAATTRHPLLVAALSRALYVGRAVRAQCGLSSSRSIGSLAVDALLSQVSRPGAARILVIGAGEMGKLALRALARRVDSVVVANRDPARAAAVAEAHGARAIGLDGVGPVLADVDAVLSAADTRGAVLTTPILEARLRRGPLAVVDIAVPRSVGPEARALLGVAYRSVDDLPSSRGKIPDHVLAIAHARCALEAQRFLASRS